MEDKFNPKIQEQDEEADKEETLSFCDLPLHSCDSADWENYCKQDQTFSLSTSSSSEEEDEDNLFEFFSSDLTNYVANYSVENILFCGKLIPSKSEKPKTEGLFRSKSKWFSTEKASKSIHGGKTNQKKSRQASNSSGYKTAKGGDKYGSLFRRVSIMAAPVKPPRWHLMMFGSARLSAEMEMKEMRNKQSNRSPAELVQAGGDDKRVRREKRQWGIIRALGCGGSYFSTAIAVA